MAQNLKILFYADASFPFFTEHDRVRQTTVIHSHRIFLFLQVQDIFFFF